jgi:hypothetical protein
VEADVEFEFAGVYTKGVAPMRVSKLVRKPRVLKLGRSKRPTGLDSQDAGADGFIMLEFELGVVKVVELSSSRSESVADVVVVHA